MTNYIVKRGQVQKGFRSILSRAIRASAEGGRGAVSFVVPRVVSGVKSGARTIQAVVVPRFTQAARTVTENYYPRASQYARDTAQQAGSRVKSRAQQAKQQTIAGAQRTSERAVDLLGYIGRKTNEHAQTRPGKRMWARILNTIGSNKVMPYVSGDKVVAEGAVRNLTRRWGNLLHTGVDNFEHFVTNAKGVRKEPKSNLINLSRKARVALETEASKQGFVYFPIEGSHKYESVYKPATASSFVPHDIRPLRERKANLESQLAQQGVFRGARAPSEEAAKLDQEIQDLHDQIEGFTNPDRNKFHGYAPIVTPARRYILGTIGGALGTTATVLATDKIKHWLETPASEPEPAPAPKGNVPVFGGKKNRAVSKMMGGKTGRMGPMPKDGDDDKGRFFQKGKYTKFYETDKQNNQMMNKSFMRNAKKFYEISDDNYYGKETAKKPNAIRKNNIGNSINMGGSMQNYGSYNPSMPNKKMMQMEPPRMKTPSPMGRPSLYTPPKPAGGSLKTFNPYPRAGSMATGMGAPTMKRMSKAQSKSSVGAKGSLTASKTKNLMQQYIDAINNNATDQWGKGNVAGMWSKLIPSVMSHPLQPNKHAGAVVELSDMKNILGMGLLQQLAPQLINGGGLSVKASVYTPSPSRGSATTKRMSKSITNVQRSGTRHVVGGLRGGSMAKRANTSNKYFK